MRFKIMGGGSSALHLVILALILGPLTHNNNEVEGIRIVYEWSRKFFDFVAATPLARKFLSGVEPVTTQKLVTARGYPIETHHTTTEDGYILELHRIPFGVNPRRPQPQDQSSRIPVILFHGNAQSSADWVINQPVEDALGFYLADSGYDVWMVNQRGNDYSTRHVTLTSSDSKFWEFSVHEIGVYDLPAMIDYVLGTTGHPKAHFIGFSLSNAAILVRPEYNKKLGIAVLMAPGGAYYEGFLYGVGKLAAPVASAYEVVSGTLGGIPILPHFVTNLLHRVLPIVCHPKVDLFGVCLIVLQVMFGHDKWLITKDKMPLITSVAPSPFSTRIVIHGLQQIGSKEFNEYDFGIRKNMEVYGRPQPPKYNLTNVQVPVAIMVGPADYHASPKAARRLAGELPNVVDLYRVKYLFFRHLDFCYSRGAGGFVYWRVVECLDAFSQSFVERKSDRIIDSGSKVIEVKNVTKHHAEEKIITEERMNDVIIDAVGSKVIEVKNVTTKQEHHDEEEKIISNDLVGVVEVPGPVGIVVGPHNIS